MDCTNTDIRKNSAEGECYSTCDELSPVKVKDTNVKKTFPKKKKKKNGNKSPFKGEAKDFKIKYKTELCKYYECDGYCKYGDKCAYAHGKENLRSKVTNTTAYPFHGHKHIYPHICNIHHIHNIYIVQFCIWF